MATLTPGTNTWNRSARRTGELLSGSRQAEKILQRQTLRPQARINPCRLNGVLCQRGLERIPERLATLTERLSDQHIQRWQQAECRFLQVFRRKTDDRRDHSGRRAERLGRHIK